MPKEDTQFRPGQSGNIKGRPTRDRCISDILRTILYEMDRDQDYTILEKILREVVKSAENGHKWAVEFIANRLEGLPHQVLLQPNGEDINSQLSRIADNLDQLDRSLC